MTLYLYKIGSTTPALTIENVQSYTNNRVEAIQDGNPITYAPLADGFELSSKPDCSETLRASYLEAPTQLDRIESQITYTAMMTNTLMEG